MEDYQMFIPIIQNRSVSTTYGILSNYRRCDSYNFRRTVLIRLIFFFSLLFSVVLLNAVNKTIHNSISTTRTNTILLLFSMSFLILCIMIFSLFSSTLLIVDLPV